MVYAITAKKIFDGENFQQGKAIIVDGNLIKDLVNLEEVRDIELINYNDAIISAGFIDLQINGCGGVLFNDDISSKTIETMSKTNLKYGTTSFLPTLITTSEENIKKAVNVASEYHKNYPNNVIGIHIEGPYISKIKKGIHNPIYMKEISQEMVDFLVDSVKNIPIKITLAPEENSLDKIKQLADGGVKVSIGHSNATYKQAKDGIKAGISLATHLFNAMSAFEGRNPNVVGAVLDSLEVYSGIIIDGNHVDFASVALVAKLKKEKLFMVTDAATPMGTDMKEFSFADQLVYVKGDKYVNKDGTLAGANINMLDSIANAVNYVNLPLSEALRMASLYPSLALNNKKLGRIVKGYIANLAVFDNNFNMVSTISNGNIVKK